MTKEGDCINHSWYSYFCCLFWCFPENKLNWQLDCRDIHSASTLSGTPSVPGWSSCYLLNCLNFFWHRVQFFGVKFRWTLVKVAVNLWVAYIYDANLSFHHWSCILLTAVCLSLLVKWATDIFHRKIQSGLLQLLLLPNNLGYLEGPLWVTGGHLYLLFTIG